MLDYQQPQNGLVKGANALGLASFICGIVSLCVAWVPFCGLIPALVLGGIGGVLGLVGLIAAKSDKRTGVGFPIAGMVTCAAAIAVGLIFTLGMAAALRHSKPPRAGATTRPTTRPTIRPASSPQVATSADPE
jgi:hypothetical protein